MQFINDQLWVSLAWSASQQAHLLSSLKTLPFLHLRKRKKNSKKVHNGIKQKPRGRFLLYQDIYMSLNISLDKEFCCIQVNATSTPFLMAISSLTQQLPPCGNLQSSNSIIISLHRSTKTTTHLVLFQHQKRINIQLCAILALSILLEEIISPYLSLQVGLEKDCYIDII